MSVEQILNREDFDLKGKYMVALETGQRVDPDIFTKDIDMLSNLHRNYKEMREILGDLLNSNLAEATVLKMMDTIKTIKNMAMNDGWEVLGELKTYRDSFHALYGNIINLTLHYNERIKETYNEVVLLMEISYAKQKTDGYLVERAGTGEEWATLLFETLDWILNDIVIKDNNSTHALPHQKRIYLDEDKCGIKVENLMRSTLSLKDAYFSIKNSNIQIYHIDLLKTKMMTYANEFGPVDLCFSRYPNILEKIQDWLTKNNLVTRQKVITENNKLREQIIKEFSDSVNLMLEVDEDLVKDVLNRYSLNKENMRKMDYLKTITTELEGRNGETLATRINTLVSRFKEMIIDNMTKQINIAQTETDSMYKDVLNLAVDVAPFLSNDYFYQKISNMEIWKEPSPNIEDPPNAIFNQQEIEMWKIWNRNMDIKTFVQVKALSNSCIVVIF